MSETRFEIRRTLGEGGMGVVYEARDTARDMIVALKTLRTQDANLLYHFKNEFRSIADLHHVNLVHLYELFEQSGQWFFTMELVEGCDFLTWIKPRETERRLATTQPGASPPAPAPRGDSGTLLEYVATRTPLATGTPPPYEPMTSYDETRLRDALAQLAAGLHALHTAGKVHRDVKPNNILVTPGGRVVIMDFGLVADDVMLAELASVRMIAGTPHFMAPEQGMPGAAIGPPADWYAVGVMLYLVLADRAPFVGGSVAELTAAKHALPPRPPPTAPQDLVDLCMALLAPDPAQRPTGDDVLVRLGARTAMSAAIASTTSGVAEVFVGRRAELGALHTALADSRRAAVAVFVEGTSGLGKTALVRRFLDEVAGTGTMILRGRCFAEETVPYKAFDGIVDALSRNLVTMAPARAAELVPETAVLAARLFPVLRRVPWFARATHDTADISGPELRSRAFAALIDVLARVAASQPLLLFVDDLQWADADSLLLLRELLHPANAPPLAFVASVRTGDKSAGEQVAERVCNEPRRIALAPLSADDAAMLVDSLVPREAATPERRQEIAREAGGHPLFLAELAQHMAVHTGANLTARLDDALWQRAMALDHDARHLLQIIAVAGAPIAQKVVADAGALSATRCAPLIAALRASRFVKTSVTTSGDNEIEPYHDRVRESVVTRMDRTMFAAASNRLGNAMLRAGLGDTAPELVVRHLFAAGDAARGGALAERAAARAMAALAFDRAAEFLRAALAARGTVEGSDAARPRSTTKSGSAEPLERSAGGSRGDLKRSGVWVDAAHTAPALTPEHARTLHLQLAEALASAGRGAEAADAFLDAGRIAGGNDEIELDCRRRAADQLLASGHVARGLTELAEVLARLGERIPESPHASLASLEVERAAIASLGFAEARSTPEGSAASIASLGFAEARSTPEGSAESIAATPIVLNERRATDIPAPLLRKLDVYQSTAIGLLLVDNVRGADYQARAVRLAIAAGEPRRLLRAIVFEAIYHLQEAESGRARGAALLEVAGGIARGRDDVWMDAYLVFGRAFQAYYWGRFRRAVELFKDADTRFRALPGVAWEQNTIRLHRLRATDYQGAWGELRALYDEYLRDAERRDDRYVSASITRWFNVLWLAHDRPDLAGADLAKSEWTPPDEGRYHLQHFLELRARVELALYRGDGAAQGEWARPGLAAADRSLLLRIQIARAIADWLLGRIAACERDVAAIEERARLLDAQGVNYAAIWGGLLAAAALHQRGDRTGAIAKLAATAGYADDNDFPLCAAIARLRAGQLATDPDAIATSVAWISNQDIRNPLRMCDVFAPGFT